MRDCVTHHFACQCREAVFDQLVDNAETLITALDGDVPDHVIPKLDALAASVAIVRGRDPLDVFRGKG